MDDKTITPPPGEKSLDESAPVEVNGTPEVELLPGTRLLVDIQHKIHAAHDADKEIVLIPQPTSDPDDPLNWGPIRKYVAFGIMCFYCMMLGAATISPGITYGALIMEFGATVNYLNTGAALSLLFLGAGNLLLNPLALKFGRRPVYLFSAVLACVSQIVAAEAKNKATAVGARILLGFAASPFEQLPAISVDDQFFIHHRGFGISLYVISLTFGSFLGPLSAGFVIESMGWRWVYWFYAIFMGLVAFLIFFFLEETAYLRKHAEPTDPSKPKKSYISKLALLPKEPLIEVPFLTLVMNPARLLTSPIVIWGGIVYGFGVSWLSVMAVTANTVFQSPVYGYNFSFSSTGLTNLSPFIGALLAIYFGGTGTDKFMVWKARKNNGIMEAESRVYSTFIAAPIMCGGLILYGVGAAKGLPWIGPVFGMAMIGAALAISGEVTLGYASEAFAGMELGGEGMVAEAVTAMVFVRNVISCAMTFAIAPWIEHSGLRDCFIEVGLLAGAVLASGFICILFGKSWRRSASKMYRGKQADTGAA
ncbi:major facilitator superfamily domain-containing protein [Tricladium varicosporioides]|nr:major facilitator superfamily domain-containing protein [Hymenoscyphus varicosporioides]